MKITNSIHRIKIVFNITPNIERSVYMYIIEGKKLYLIDTGVDGTEKIIADYINTIGRKTQDIEAVLLTHSHPDHIGGVCEIKNMSNCEVYACHAESEWISNINKQYEDRPIPNFYKLLNKSVKIDKYLKDGDLLELEENITIKVINTKGHSEESLSFYYIQEKALFTGDAIPIIGDIPIYISAKQSIETLEKLINIKNIDHYLSAWDEEKDHISGLKAINDAIDHLKNIDTSVKNIILKYPNKNREEIFNIVCKELGMEQFSINPLFKKSIFSNIDET